jgi:hypothetical protein
MNETVVRNESMIGKVDVHTLIAGRMDGTISEEAGSQITRDPLYPSSKWVIAFCYGRKWCCLLHRVEFQRFLDADVAIPIRNDYLHSIAMPEVLDVFCEELATYRSRMTSDCFEYTLAIAHLSLQEINHQINPYSVTGRATICRVLIKLTIFYHLLFRNLEMSEWAGWEAETSGDVGRGNYLFVWRMSTDYDEKAEVIHILIGHNYQYTDQHVWPEWLETRLDTIDGDVSLEIVPARTKWLRRKGKSDSYPLCISHPASNE